MKEDDMVDLEQFREAVKQAYGYYPVVVDGELHNQRDADRFAGFRLLSIIDSAGKVECAEVSAYIASIPDKCDRIIWRGQYHHLPPHQPAPVVDDAMVDAAIAAQDAHWANDANYPARAPGSAKGDAELHDKLARGAMRAALTAALSSVQGVERE